MPTPDATAREFAPTDTAAPAGPASNPASPTPPSLPGARREVGGAPGPEPTRYGDWERAGRCIDF